MPGRTRRVRVIALIVFSIFAYALYIRTAATTEDHRQYADKTLEDPAGGGSGKGSGVGGGAVLRPHDSNEAGKEYKMKQDGRTTTSTRSADVVKTTSRAVAQGVLGKTKVAEHPLGATTSATRLVTTRPASTTTYGVPAVTDVDSVPYELGQGRIEVPSIRPSATPIHWVSQTEHFPVSYTMQLPSGKPSKIPTIQHKFSRDVSNGADIKRLLSVKAAASHAWYGYREKAWGKDEIMPVSGGYKNPFNAWSATLVDALDTLFLLDMTAEFEEAVDFVATIDFTTTPRYDIPLFETTIRYLGGLLAAYDVSGQKHTVLLDKALELGEILYGAFDTPNRMPKTYYSWQPAFASQPHRADARVVLAELGSLSMEFTRLAQLTGKPKFYDAIARITSEFEEYQNNTRLPGMWPTYIDASGCGKPAQLSPDKSYALAEQPAKVEVSENVLSQAEEDVNRQFRASVKEQANKADARKNGGSAGKIAHSDVKSGSSRSGTGAEVRLGSDGEIVGTVRLGEDASRTLQKRQMQRTSAGVAQSVTSGYGPHTGDTQSLTGANVCVPQGLSSSGIRSSESYTLAGMSDSTYEYLPKMWLLLSGQVEQYRQMYLTSMDAVRERLLYRPMTRDNRDILFSGDLDIFMDFSSEAREIIESFKPVGSHLVCFVGGMFAMGGKIFDRPEDVEIGRKLTDGCIWAYNVTATGIMPEDFFLVKCDSMDSCAWNETRYNEELDPHREARMRVNTAVPDTRTTQVQQVVAIPVPTEAALVATSDLNKRQLDSGYKANVHSVDGTDPDKIYKVQTIPAPRPVHAWPPPVPHLEFVRNRIEGERLPPGFKSLTSRNYILRPEAIESVFYMYRITGEQYWRDRGWEMFRAIEKYTKTEWGHSAIHDVTMEEPLKKDSEESFWLAETLKYFYLLFDDPENWSLDEWVLNTEAHFFKRAK